MRETKTPGDSRAFSIVYALYQRWDEAKNIR